MSDVQRCDAVVYKRDTYRVVRGKGFRMYYEKCQCSRRANFPPFCSQHANMPGVKRWTRTPPDA